MLAPGAGLEVAELGRFVAGRLADFKAPRVVRIVEDIPKGPTGKLQRIGLAKALSIEGIDDSASVVATEHTAPRDVVEEELARIWSRILRVERIGVHDHFLALGGDSVLAMRIISQAAESLGIRVSGRSLFNAATVAAMAEEVRRLRGETESSST